MLNAVKHLDSIVVRCRGDEILRRGQDDNAAWLVP